MVKYIEPEFKEIVCSVEDVVTTSPITEMEGTGANPGNTPGTNPPIFG